jgi:hypothetical protein
MSPLKWFWDTSLWAKRVNEPLFPPKGEPKFFEGIMRQNREKTEGWAWPPSGLGG